MYWSNLKSVALPVPEIIGYTQKIGQSLDMPTHPFLRDFSWAIIRMDTVIVLAKFEVRSLPVPEIIAIGVLDGVGTPNIWQGEAVGDRGWYRSKERR